MLAETGYSQTAIKYYLEKPNMREMGDADQVSEFLGSCGDTMKVFLKIENDVITDASYQVLGCPGAGLPGGYFRGHGGGRSDQRQRSGLCQISE